MNWTVVWSEAARRDLKRCDRDICARALAAVEQLANTGRGDVKKLQGTANQYRLRVGSWRVFLTYDKDGRQLIVLRVLERKNAY